jgi:hypothetical protein
MPRDEVKVKRAIATSPPPTPAARRSSAGPSEHDEQRIQDGVEDLVADVRQHVARAEQVIEEGVGGGTG